MIYSVWNHADRTYDYYRTPEQSAASQAPKPKHMKGTSVLGLVPEEAAWPLPSNARHVGKGSYPKGMIASPSGGNALGFLDFLPSFTGPSLVIYGVVGFFVWRWWKKRGV